MAAPTIKTTGYTHTFLTGIGREAHRYQKAVPCSQRRDLMIYERGTVVSFKEIKIKVGHTQPSM